MRGEKVDKVFSNFNNVIEKICNVLLVLMTLLVTYVVFMRYVMNDTPVWGEETVRLFLVWLTFLGASLGLGNDTHIRLNAIDTFLSPKILKMMDWFSIVILFLFSLFMIIEGINMAMLGTGSKLPGLGIQTAWVFAAIPIAGILNMIQLINKGRKLL
jgi:TRAP-type C4-dicarboxylate transport system permease small subunit